jgi:hypothetical protein
MRRKIYEILYLTSCKLLLDSSGVWSFPKLSIFSDEIDVCVRIVPGIDDECESESLK